MASSSRFTFGGNFNFVVVLKNPTIHDSEMRQTCSWSERILPKLNFELCLHQSHSERVFVQAHTFMTDIDKSSHPLVVIGNKHAHSKGE